MLTVYKTPSKIIGLSFGKFLGLEIFCDIDPKDGRCARMVNRVIIGNTDMTDSRVFGIDASHAKYYVFFCFRLIILTPKIWINDEKSNAQIKNRPKKESLVSLDTHHTNLLARNFAQLLADVQRGGYPLSTQHFAALKAMRDFYYVVNNCGGEPSAYILVFKNLYEFFGDEAVCDAIDKSKKYLESSRMSHFDNLKHHVGRAADQAVRMIEIGDKPMAEYANTIMNYLYLALKPYEWYFKETYIPFDSLHADDALNFIGYYEEKHKANNINDLSTKGAHK